MNSTGKGGSRHRAAHPNRSGRSAGALWRERQTRGVRRDRGNRTISRLIWLAAALPLLALALVYPHLPERVPVHYDAAWRVDRYADKTLAALLPFGFIGFLGPLLMKPLAYGSLRAQAAKGNGSPALVRFMNVSALLVTLIFAALGVFSLTSMLSKPLWSGISLPRVLLFLLGATLLYTGNFLPKLKRGGVSGFRTPRTLRSDEAWARAQRLAGRIWTAGGLAVAVCAFLPGRLVYLAAPVMLAMIALPLALSRRITD